MDKYNYDDTVHSEAGRTFRVLWTTKRDGTGAQSELRVRDNHTRQCCKLPVHRITHHEPTNRKGK